MRRIAILFLLPVLGLVLFLVATGRLTNLFHPKTGNGNDVRQAVREPSKTNPPTGPAEGFYVGKGDQRTYIQYATPDPVLRSFMQSVMEGGSDPTAKGKEIFLKICAACHQPDGKGKDGLAPPLAGSEWVLAPRDGRLVRIVLNGLNGHVQVLGKDWNLAMPPLRENLRDDQIAVVLTYIRTQVGNNHAGLITPEMAAAARKETHPKPETSEELLQFSDQ